MQTNIDVHARQDGTWIEFKASDGKSWSLKAEDMKPAGPLMQSALEQWIKDRRSERHTHVAGTTVGKDIDECAKCGQDLRADIHAGQR